MDSRTTCLEEDMVARVAMAIAAEVARSPIMPSIPYDAYLPIARAAIEAMRHPTEAMIDAALSSGLDIYWNYEADGTPGSPKDAFRIMIDAALTSRPK